MSEPRKCVNCGKDHTEKRPVCKHCRGALKHLPKPFQQEMLEAEAVFGSLLKELGFDEGDE